MKRRPARGAQLSIALGAAGDETQPAGGCEERTAPAAHESVAEQLGEVAAELGQVEELGELAGEELTALQLGGAAELIDPAELIDRTLARAINSETPASIYLKQRSESSRRTLGEALDAIASIASGGLCDRDSFPWGKLRYPHAVWIRSKLVEKHAAATVNKMLAAFRGVMHEAFMLGDFGPEGADHYHRARAIKNVRGERVPTGRPISAGELRALYGVCGSSTRGRRDAALLTVFRQAGARRGELVAIELADYNRETGDLIIRKGKGNKQRAAFISNEGKDAIESWLEVRGLEAGPLLCPLDKWGNVRRRRLHTDSVRYILFRRYTEASVSPFVSHDLRRTFASDLLASGYDLSLVQKLMGHARADQTAGYDVRADTARRHAAHSLHVPFRRG
jgi:integrase